MSTLRRDEGIFIKKTSEFVKKGLKSLHDSLYVLRQEGNYILPLDLRLKRLYGAIFCRGGQKINHMLNKSYGLTDNVTGQSAENFLF